MRLFGGIDLGSTTTKCVLVDDDETVVGQGITNTRSNYDVACEVARTEAHLDARLRLLSKALQDEFGGADASRELADGIARALRLEHYLTDLERLGQRVLATTEEERHAAGADELRAVLGEALAELRRRAEGHFAPGVATASDFFRDLAGSDFMELVERLARPPHATFETLMGIYDKSILAVENEPPAFSFERAAGAALDRALAEGAAADHAERAARALRSVLETGLDVAATVGTGYGRQRLPFDKEWIRSEILCHGLGAHTMFPNTATVLDIGGQDTKAIQVDPSGIVTGFQMNDRCAAGCGRFLGYIADELNLGLHELGPLALSARRTLPVNSTCTVFASSELRDRLAAGEKREEIISGLHRAIVLRAMSLIARAGGVRSEFTFTGGVARNQAVVHFVKELSRENYGSDQINISADSIYTGALGAALFAQRSSRQMEEVPA